MLICLDQILLFKPFKLRFPKRKYFIVRFCIEARLTIEQECLVVAAWNSANTPPQDLLKKLGLRNVGLLFWISHAQLALFVWAPPVSISFYCQCNRVTIACRNHCDCLICESFDTLCLRKRPKLVLGKPKLSIVIITARKDIVFVGQEESVGPAARHHHAFQLLLQIMGSGLFVDAGQLLEIGQN